MIKALVISFVIHIICFVVGYLIGRDKGFWEGYTFREECDDLSYLIKSRREYMRGYEDGSSGAPVQDKED